MFADLDATLGALLDTSAAPATLRAADLAFDCPDRDFKPAQSTVNLFLYDVAENRELRDPARHLTRSGNGYEESAPPLRVDCAYLVTTWSTKAGPVKTAEEHQLLAVALTWLARFPVVDDTFLSGGLKNPPQPYPVQIRVAQVKEGYNLGHFWSALGISPRANFTLTATVALQPFDEVVPFSLVQQMGPDDLGPRLRFDYTSVSDPALTGRVLDHTLVGVAQAEVTEVKSGATTTTETNGRFTLAGLEFGDHLLRAVAVGHPDVEKSVHFSPTSQIHDLILPSP